MAETTSAVVTETPAAPPAAPPTAKEPQSREDAFRQAIQKEADDKASPPEGAPSPEAEKAEKAEKAESKPERENAETETKQKPEEEEFFEGAAFRDLSDGAKAAVKANPDLKGPVNGYFAYRAIGTPKEFRQFKQVFDSPEQATEAIEAAQAFQNLRSLVVNGEVDPVVRAIYEDSQKNAGAFLESVVRQAYEGRLPEFNDVANNIIAATLRSNYQTALRGGNEEVAGGIAVAFKSHFGTDIDSNQTFGPRRDPERERRDAESRQREQQKIEAIQSEASDLIGDALNGAVEEEFDKVFPAGSYDQDDIELAWDRVCSAVVDELTENPNWRRAVESAKADMAGAGYVSNRKASDFVSRVFPKFVSHSLARELSEASRKFSRLRVGEANAKVEQKSAAAARTEVNASPIGGVSAKKEELRPLPNESREDFFRRVMAS